MTALHVGDVVEWDTFAGSVVEVERGRVIAVTPTEVRTMCHRARWRGRGAGTYYTVECCWQLAELDRLRKVGLPTPSMSATIDHTAPGLGDALRRARTAAFPSKARDISQASAERFLASRAKAGAP